MIARLQSQLDGMQQKQQQCTASSISISSQLDAARAEANAARASNAANLDNLAKLNTVLQTKESDLKTTVEKYQATQREAEKATAATATANARVASANARSASAATASEKAATSAAKSAATEAAAASATNVTRINDELSKMKQMHEKCVSDFTSISEQLREANASVTEAITIVQYSDAKIENLESKLKANEAKRQQLRLENNQLISQCQVRRSDSVDSDVEESRNLIDAGRRNLQNVDCLVQVVDAEQKLMDEHLKEELQRQAALDAKDVELKEVQEKRIAVQTELELLQNEFNINCRAFIAKPASIIASMPPPLERRSTTDAKNPDDSVICGEALERIVELEAENQTLDRRLTTSKRNIEKKFMEEQVYPLQTELRAAQTQNRDLVSKLDFYERSAFDAKRIDANSDLKGDLVRTRAGLAAVEAQRAKATCEAASIDRFWWLLARARRFRQVVGETVAGLLPVVAAVRKVGSAKRKNMIGALQKAKEAADMAMQNDEIKDLFRDVIASPNITAATACDSVQLARSTWTSQIELRVKVLAALWEQVQEAAQTQINIIGTKSQTLKPTDEKKLQRQAKEDEKKKSEELLKALEELDAAIDAAAATRVAFLSSLSSTTTKTGGTSYFPRHRASPFNRRTTLHSRHWTPAFISTPF
jgi:hypothetical protein